MHFAALSPIGGRTIFRWPIQEMGLPKLDSGSLCLLLKRFDFATKGVEFVSLHFQKPAGQVSFGHNTFRCKEISVASLVSAAAKVLNFYQAFVYERPEAIVCLTHAHTQLMGNPALRHDRTHRKQAQQRKVFYCGNLQQSNSPVVSLFNT